MLLIEQIAEQKQDAVLFKADFLIKNAGSGVDEIAKAVSTVAVMLACIENPIKRSKYVDIICKAHKLKPKDLNAEINKHAEEENAIAIPEDMHWSFPKGVDIEKALRQGFYALLDKLNTGYYFPIGRSSEWQRQSNFVLTPLMHVRSITDDARLFEINNGMEKQMIDMPSRQMLMLDQFVGRMFEAPGNNLFWGNKLQLMKIFEAIGREFQYCYPLKTLGWQQEGFFAYSNGVVTDDGFIAMNEIGIAEVSGTKYYSPSASSLYSNIRQDDDEYANDRYLTYKPSAIDFETWARLLIKVYSESNSGMIGVAAVLMALFQDVIRAMDKNCPHISAYGEKGSGKSKFLESLSNVFFTDLPPCNLFHSTDFAFANRLSRYSNCAVWFDEFNDATIREERFEAIKAAYDGVARERGKGGSKSKTEILRVRVLLLLSGQYLSTKDDNAALTRCIVIPFKKRSEETARTSEEINDYNQLKIYEAEGLSGMLPALLKYRKEFEKWYAKNFPEVFNDMRESISKTHRNYNERVMRNYSALVATSAFFAEKIKLPYKVDEFTAIIKQEIIKLSNLINESDSLAEFWNTVVFLMETGEIYEGYHFKIQEVQQVIIGNTPKNFDNPVKLIFLRLKTVHALYMQAHRKQTGNNGVNMKTIELYVTTSKGYVGQNKNSRFTDRDGQSQVTSSYVFEYDKLGVELERFAPAPRSTEEKVIRTVTGKVYGNGIIKDIAGVPKLSWDLMEDASYEVAGSRVEKLVKYKCYSTDLDKQLMVHNESELRVTGEFTEKKWKPKDSVDYVITRVIDVTKIEVVLPQTSMDFKTNGDSSVKPDDLPF